MNPSPGPWRGTGRGRWVEFVDANDETTYVRSEDIADSVAKDNCALVAAAPEMREMLLKLDGGITECPFCSVYPLPTDAQIAHSPGCAFGALLERIR